MAYVEAHTESSLEPVVFRTQGEWLASELTALLSGVEVIYATFVTAIAALEVREATALQNLALGERLSRREGALVPFTVGDSQTLDYALDRSDRVFEVFPEARLAIVSIEMSSPGGISLAGLGEPIQQLREFIKDLWYRNKQEKQAGQLEILRQWLAIEREFGPLPPTITDRLAPKALQGVRVLEQLEAQGKLVDIPTSVAG